MQKNNKKASILIWAIILSLILSVTFISLSNKINLNLRQNISITKNSEENLKIEDNLKKIENIFIKIKNLALKENITASEKENINKYFDEIEELKNISEDKKIEINLKNENFLLENSKNLEIIIPPNSNILLNVSWWKINFNSENIISNLSLKQKENSQIESSKNFSSSEFFKKIIFKNSSWEYSKISIITADYIISPKKNFRIIEKFWKKEILKKEWFLQIN